MNVDIRIALDTLTSRINEVVDKQEKTYEEVFKEVKSQWSDVLDLLEPYQKIEESFFQTAQRVLAERDAFEKQVKELEDEIDAIHQDAAGESI